MRNSGRSHAPEFTDGPICAPDVECAGGIMASTLADVLEGV